MPLRGGSSDKFGNRFEGRWTALQLINVLDESADSVRLEPPGAEGEGVEFWVRLGQTVEYHQVKRQNGAEGRWTIASLNERGVLTNFQERLANPNASCVFASTHSVQHLDDLIDYASRANSYSEFDREFLKAARLRASFAKLRSCWVNAAVETCFQYLKRLAVRTIDEETLQFLVESQIAVLVAGQPANTVVALLAQFALDQIHRELTALEIWKFLETNGCSRREWNKDPHVLAAVETQNNRYLAPLKAEAIRGELFERVETTQVLEKLLSDQKSRGVAVVGEAGIGKSSITPQILERLVSLGWPTLAFRVNQVEPSTVPDKVGEDLGLPGSPARVLAAIAQGNDAVLIVDQLDTVSLVSGRSPQFFDCINEIIQQALSYPKIHVVLGCRRFDLENDPRLMRLVDQSAAEIIQVKRLSPEEVRHQVQQLNLDSDRLTKKQIDLLSVPLHLSLLSEIAAGDSTFTFNFETVKELYDKFWNRKQELVRARVGREVQWTEIIDTLCDYMSEKTILSAPNGTLDKFRDVAAIISEHVVRLDNKRHSFFHESFFDYAFARRFAARGDRLMPLLLSTEQHLFRRAQVRQILLHERERDRAIYLDDLSALLFSPEIRFHLKNAVFALLADIDEPTHEEWDILAPSLEDPAHDLYLDIWVLLYRSPSWFRLVDSLGLVQQWLSDEGNPERINRTINVLQGVQRTLPDRVAELLKPKLGVSPEWNNRIGFIFQWSDLSLGSGFQEFTLQAIDAGTLDSVRGPVVMNSDFWDLSHGVPEKNPAQAARIIGRYYERWIAIAQNYPEEEAKRIIVDGLFNTARHGHEDYFIKTANRAPHEFVENVLPMMLRVMELTANRRNDPPWSDGVWFHRRYGEVFGSADALLEGMAAALSLLSASEPDLFSGYAITLSHSEFEAAHFLLLRGYTGNPSRFADDAAAYLCADRRRLGIGYRGDARWAARMLIQAITPYCTESSLVKLEDLLLHYYPDRERTAVGRTRYGHAQFTLLEGIQESRRSARVIRRLEELKRKFRKETVEKPTGVVARAVGSPIAADAAEKMSNEQWLKAIERYGDDSLETKLINEEFVGGAVELSRVLEAQAKQAPDRFADLTCRFPDGTDINYFEGVLRGVAEADGLQLDSAIRLINRCHELPDRPVGRWLVRLIERLADMSLPDHVLQIAAFYATEDADPDQELWRTNSGSGQTFFGGSIDMAALNSTRGAAALAVGRLIYRNAARLPKLLPTMECMVDDPSITVRAAAAHALMALLNHDRDTAVRLFAKLCDTEDALLRSDAVELFVKHALITHYAEMKPILDRMIATQDMPTNVAGARQVCMAALYDEAAHVTLQSCLEASEHHRKGVAQVLAANLSNARFRSFCEAQLIKLFNDPAQDVRSEASQCFNHLEEDLSDYSNLISAFVSSTAFSEEHRCLFQALEKATSPLPEITCEACERFFDSVGYAASDMSTHAGAESYLASQLIIRTYAQSRSPLIVSRCLDVIDRFFRMQALGITDSISSYDR